MSAKKMQTVPMTRHVFLKNVSILVSVPSVAAMLFAK